MIGLKTLIVRLFLCASHDGGDAPGSGGGNGVDIRAENDGATIAIQCKR
jgi:hypothetical protein